MCKFKCRMNLCVAAGTLLAIGLLDGTIVIWDVVIGADRAMLPRHGPGSPVRDLDFHV